MKKLVLLFLCLTTIRLFASETIHPKVACTLTHQIENNETNEAYNPLLSLALRTLAKSFIKRQVKRQTKKYVRSRFGKMTVNQAADYAVDYTIDQLEQGLSRQDQRHITSYWTAGKKNTDHFNHCRICSKTGDEMVNVASYTAVNSSGEPNMPSGKRKQKGPKKHPLKQYNGLRFNASFSVPRTDEIFHSTVLEEGTAVGGGSASLEYQVSVLQFETGYKYFETQHENFNIAKYNLRGIYGIGSITLPWLKVIAPSVGGGYQLSRVEYQQNGATTRFDNNGVLIHGALSINPSTKWSIQGRYNRLIQTDAFETELFEVGLKFRLN